MDRKMILLFLASTVCIISACLQDVPDFIITSNPRSTPTSIEAIVVTSDFSCEGRVSRWRACLANDPRMVNYRINFQVWRQDEDDGAYILVGSNRLSSTTATDIDIPAEVFDTYCISVEVPQEAQISVVPEDYVGFHIEMTGPQSANTGGILLSDEAGVVLYSGGTKPLDPGERFSSGNSQTLFGAPFLDAIVGVIAEGPEGDAALITTSTLTYTTSGPSVSPTVHATRVFPGEHTLQSSMTHTPSSAHIPINVTTAEDSNTEQSVSRTISSAKISESQWSCSTHILSPSIAVKDIGQDGSTLSGNDFESTAVYILLAVGVVIAIVSITVATTTVVFVCKYKTRNQTTEGNIIKARAASELINNSSYESPNEQVEITTNLRPNSTGYHSHWSLTHINTDSTHYSYPSAEVGASYLCNSEYNTPTHYGNGVSGTTTSGEAVSVYYSTPIKRVEPSSIFLSENEAYDSKNPTSVLLSANEAYSSRNPASISVSENESYTARNPTSIPVSENSAYESGNAGEASTETTSGTNTDSVSHTSPTETSSEEFDGSSNQAYGSSPRNTRLLQQIM